MVSKHIDFMLMIITLCVTSLILITASYFSILKYLQHLGLAPDDCLVSHQFSEQLMLRSFVYLTQLLCHFLDSFQPSRVASQIYLRSCHLCGTNSVTPGWWESLVIGHLSSMFA